MLHLDKGSCLGFTADHTRIIVSSYKYSMSFNTVHPFYYLMILSEQTSITHGMNKITLTDTCFWFGLVDPKDQYHSVSSAIAELIEDCRVLFPWPCLYETISTHLTRRRDQLIRLEKIISKPNIILLDYNNYRNDALKQVFHSNEKTGFS